MDSIIDLADRLQKANWAYHNTDTPTMGDDEYDRLLELLRSKAPSHPFLKCIGATPDANTTILPVPLASLDKVRMGEAGLQRWQKRRAMMGVESCVVSEKLDGLSALLIYDSKVSLYLRGDGVKGVCVNRILPSLALPSVEPCMIRGELVLSHADTPAGSVGRSLVNGWVHRALDTTKPLPKELSKVHFVAYQLISHGLPRGDQMAWLARAGFRVAPWHKEPLKPLTEDTLYKILVRAKEGSAYPIDGIVIGTDTVPATVGGGGEAKNPPDCIAFKASLEEQKKETTVLFVEWNVSRLNTWIPRIQIEPVVIGGAKIEWMSGHSAKMISEGVVGKGARIVLRRSGDVIPTLDSVVSPCPTGPCLPPAGSWDWDANRVHAVRKEGSMEGTAGLAEKALLHALQTLGVEGIGPGLVANLVKGGVMDFPSLLTADPSVLKEALGPTRYSKVMELVKSSLEKASPCTLCIASNLLPRGVGERKLRPLFSKEASPRRWTPALLEGIEGWSKDTLAGLFAALPGVLIWCQAVKPGCFDLAAATAASTATAAALISASASPAQQKSVVFTGVRPDAALQEAMTRSGWKMSDSLTKVTHLLVHADGAKETGKLATARKYGIEACSISQFRARC
uniref:NAD-dependent DNA ligase N-terminal domain-containing protein n=1 Tax=viral metagenome TaxID=1070528 RepID=A0A6C0L729_9ZZZZ